MPLYLGTKEIDIPFSKVYLGDILKYEKINYIDTAFSSCPFPTSWTQTSGVTDYTSYYASNTYGNWKISAESCLGFKYKLSNMFDGNGSSYFKSEVGNGYYVTIELPSGISIKPTNVQLDIDPYTPISTYLQGLNEYGVWENICSLSYTANDWTEKTFTAGTDKFYTKFKVNTNNVIINELKITSGTIRKYS